MVVALIAALAMVANDICSTILVMAEAAERGWLAGAMDTLGWGVAICTTTISVTALQGHSLSEKVWVVALVSSANLFGTKLGQVAGTRLLHSRHLEHLLHREGLSLEQRVAALELSKKH